MTIMVGVRRYDEWGYPHYFTEKELAARAIFEDWDHYEQQQIREDRYLKGEGERWLLGVDNPYTSEGYVRHCRNELYALRHTPYEAKYHDPIRPNKTREYRKKRWKHRVTVAVGKST